MKAIIPVAGEGTRLRPLTHSLPKVLVGVAGKPILGHILDRLVRYEIRDLILVTGYLGDQVVQYVRENYDFNLDCVNQEERRGLGHAIYLTKDYLDSEPALIIYGDTVFEANLAPVFEKEVSAIGVKEVKDPRRFGVILHENGRITGFIEKPDKPISNLAIVGINYIKNTPLLFDALTKLIQEGMKTKGEYQLTDAFQIMLDRGEEMHYFPVEGWYDCGKPETLLETNRSLLRNMRPPAPRDGCILIPPVFVAENAQVENAILGPNVSIDQEAKINSAILSDTIVSRGASVRNIILKSSLVGASAVVYGQQFKMNVGDSSTVNIGPGGE